MPQFNLNSSIARIQLHKWFLRSAVRPRFYFARSLLFLRVHLRERVATEQARTPHLIWTRAELSRAITLIAALAMLLSPMIAFSSVITYRYTGTFNDGRLAGQTYSGRLSWDDEAIGNLLFYVSPDETYYEFPIVAFAMSTSEFDVNYSAGVIYFDNYPSRTVLTYRAPDTVKPVLELQVISNTRLFAQVDKLPTTLAFNTFDNNRQFNFLEYTNINCPDCPVVIGGGPIASLYPMSQNEVSEAPTYALLLTVIGILARRFKSRREEKRWKRGQAQLRIQ
jgi:hypothetical protein